MQTVTIPTDEYSALKNELSLLKEQELLFKVNNLIDLLYESKYGLYLGDFTDDLTQANINSIEEWKISGDVWNEV
jgi:hypothetical protein